MTMFSLRFITCTTVLCSLLVVTLTLAVTEKGWMPGGGEIQFFELKDDMSPEGLVTMENGNTIELRNVARLVTCINAGGIAEREPRATSMMPTGLTSKLSLEEPASLFAYLKTLR